MPTETVRQINAIHEVAKELAKLTKAVEAINTNLVIIGKFLKEKSPEVIG
jgi:hypothetical protein